VSEKLAVYLCVGLGGALGGMGRFWLSGLAAQRFGETFPWGTLLVNVSGSLTIGLFAALTGPDGRLLVGPRFSQFFMAGLCGGYTTFSSFSLQTLNLVREGQWAYAAANAFASLALCLLAVWIGYVVGMALNR
jgi:CrcB protein